MYKKSAKDRDLFFDLTKEQFDDITNNTCSYCDKYSTEKDFVGIDRLINSRGYILSNCIPCCDKCNYMKRDMAVEEFLEHIKNIFNFNKE